MANHSASDRVAAFFNLIPDGLPIRLNFRNAKNPNRLNAYHVDSEFILQLNPLVELNDAKLGAMTLVESFAYTQPKLSLADIAALHPDVHWAALATADSENPEAAPMENEPTSPEGGAQPSIWKRL